MGRRDLTKIRLSYVREFVDRHGKIRRYVRLPGRKRVPLPGRPGSAAFNAVYEAAIGELPETPSPLIGASRTIAGTVNAAVISYFNSATFKAGAPDTVRTRRNILERFRVEHGDKRIATLRRVDIERMVATRAETPSAARNFLLTLRALMAHCIRVELRADDPTHGVKPPRIKTEGYRTWSEADIAAFETKHAIGTRARLALALLLYTAQRRSDVIKLGRQHVRDGMLYLRQQKTGAPLAIPVHPELAAIIEATACDHLTFLTTATGKPFSAAGFTNWFRDSCNAAGLAKGTSAHGLRKAACRRLAEAGCSANVIAAVSGHASLREVQRYTAAADQARMARAAIDTMVAAFPPTRTSVGNPQ
jgi:integrase